jgi:hypothetical protein
VLRVLDQVDVVVLDMSGYVAKNVGTGYELQLIIDNIPIERVIFLCDPYSDWKFLEAAIEKAWQRTVAGSPNQSGSHRTAVLTRYDYIYTVQQLNPERHGNQPTTAAQGPAQRNAAARRVHARPGRTSPPVPTVSSQHLDRHR